MSAHTLRRYEEEPNYPKTIKPHEQEALLRKVAEIAELPYEFFTVDFADLAGTAEGPSVEDRLARLEQLFDAIAQDAGFDDYRALVNSTRRVTGALKDRLPDVEPETPAHAKTRDEGDANPGETPPPGEATRRSGGSTAG